MNSSVFYRHQTVNSNVILLFSNKGQTWKKQRRGLVICIQLIYEQSVPFCRSLLTSSQRTVQFFCSSCSFLQKLRFKEILFYTFRFKKRLLCISINCKVFVPSCVLFVAISRSCVIVSLPSIFFTEGSTWNCKKRLLYLK